MYDAPWVTDVVGAPLIVGGLFVAAALVTVMLNGASDALLRPSLTEIAMLLNVPASALCGVPRSVPVAVSKAAHAGRLLILNVSDLPSGSLALGVKRYAFPATTDAAGVPEIVGGRLLREAHPAALETSGSPAIASTAGSHARNRPFAVTLHPAPRCEAGPVQHPCQGVTSEAG